MGRQWRTVGAEMRNMGFDLNINSDDYLSAAVLVSLLSVWVLVGLFVYLNRYTRREYFNIWTAAWLFYALWLTLGLSESKPDAESWIFLLRQCCVAISAVFLLWGSLRFLDVEVRQTLFGLFMLFMVVWTVSGRFFKLSVFEIQLPVFILLGLGSMFAAVCFHRMRKKKPFLGAGMLSLGFLLWGLYLASYPIFASDWAKEEYRILSRTGFLIAAVLQLFIAVSMIVLVLEEARYHIEELQAELTAARSDKEALQAKSLSAEEQCRSLYNEVRLRGSVQQAYDELRRMQGVVVQQERLRALGQMASGVAHDINNALCPITSYSELLLNTQPGLLPSSRDYLGHISRAGQDIAKIVARMREFYRRRSDSEALSEVDLNAVVRQVIELTRPRWRDVSQREGISIQVQTELESGLPTLRSDASELREALTNLIFNAVDALPHGGTITLATRLTKPAAAEGGASDVRQVQLEVRDNGMGMSKEVRQACLEPFFSTKAQRSGTGLGLAMVYGMMQRHEGEIEIESEPGQGACFRLIFPVSHGKCPPLSAPPGTASVSRSLRILCIDDEEKVRQLLLDCLQQLGHRVSVEADGKGGVRAFLAAVTEKQPFDVVVTDLGMPGLDGQQVARAIKAESPATPVVMMTGWGSMMQEEGQKMIEVDVVVSKPPKVYELNSLLLKLTAPPP